MREIDLRTFRKNKRMNQTEFAALLGVTQDKVSRMERNPGSITIDELLLIAEKTGCSTNQLLKDKKAVIEALQVEDTWSETKKFKDKVVTYFNKIEMVDNSTNTNYEELKNEVISMLDKTIRKPKVVVLGRSDTGKSTMINSLLGIDMLPTNYAPTTSVTVYVKHVDDKPTYTNDELLLFKKSINNEKWDENLLYDKDYFEKWKIASGTAEMLEAYGTREGRMYSENIGSAVFFVDSPILKNCDILDVPGYTGGIESDNLAAYEATSKADVLVFLSISKGFLGEEDLTYLNEGIKSLYPIEKSDNDDIKPLSNLFIVATHAQDVETGEEGLKRILDSGCERWRKTIAEQFWDRRTQVSGVEYTEQDFRDCFYTYTTNIEELRNNFEDKMILINEEMPRIVLAKVKELLKEKCNSFLEEINIDIENYEEFKRKKVEYEKLLEEIEVNEPLRKMEIEEKNAKIIDNIRGYKEDTKKELKKEYYKTMSVDNIINIIEKKDYKNKKKDIQLLNAYINSILEEKYTTCVGEQAEKFSSEIDNYLDDVDSVIKRPGLDNPNIDMSDFNTKRVFASGIAAAATYGGLAWWASTCGNLGGYILIAKGVSILSALGISVGGTAAAISSVSALGGPVILGIALSIISAISIFGIFTGTWKKNVAKALIKEYEKHDMLGKYYECSDKFWYETENSFKVVTESFEEQWKKYIEKIRNIINKEDDLKRKSCLKRIKNIFEKLITTFCK